MIISASRRTDIPAFYSEWLLNRMREGTVLTRNPFNPRQVSRISLDPRTVDCIVFWTKHPAPLLPRLHEIERLGHRFYFQYTLTAYGRDLETYVPPRADRLRTFQALAERIGPERVLWRFDPILFTSSRTPDDVLKDFADLASELRGSTRQCTISFLTLYAKCRRNLAAIPLREPDNQEKIRFVRLLAEIAGHNDITLRACCDPFLQQHCSIEAAHCIDDRLLAAILGRSAGLPRDKGQRPGCGCAVSVDIGAYNTCSHGCRYCYANSSDQTVASNRRLHDPRSPLLFGTLNGDERITDRVAPGCSPQGSLF